MDSTTDLRMFEIPLMSMIAIVVETNTVSNDFASVAFTSACFMQT
jgi:hypothetical protein